MLGGALSVTACSSAATEGPLRHQAMLGDQQLSVSAEGLYIDTQQIASGDFFSLKTVQLADDSYIFGVMEGNTQELWTWRWQQDEAQPLWRTEITTRVVEDMCFYQSTENQQLTLFLIGGRGGAEQLLVQQDQTFLPEPLQIREIGIPFDSTACAVSEPEQILYVAEADQAIWAYQAEPEEDEGRHLVAARTPFGEIQAEMKALTWLADGSLVAVEEEPARALLYRRQTDGQLKFETAKQFPDAEALTDVASLPDGQLWFSDEEFRANESWAIEVGEAVESTQIDVSQVAATLETQPSPRRGDAIDDPAVWIHPANAEQSRILATDKRTGLYVYDMQGQIVQELAVGRLNNVDVRGSIAAASLRDDNSLQVFSISSQGELALAASIPTTLTEIYGLCMGFDAESNSTSIYVNAKSGQIQHFVLDEQGSGVLARELSVPSQPEGCVVDDRTQRLFVGEEDEAVWLFDARANGSTTGEVIVTVAEHPQLVDDIEGLAFAYWGDKPYLFVSSQGNDSYIVFDGEAPWALRSHFRIRTNVELGLDGASETDGIEVTTQSLGMGFENGALLVQDGRNRMPEGGQNVKLVPLETIFAQF